MKVNGFNPINYANQAYRKNNETINKSNESKTDAHLMRDSIELSETSRDIKEHIKKMDTSETVDKAKVDRIKRAIENGTYKVSAKELAEAIVDNIIEQNKVGEE